ncbi:nitrogen permease regulator 3-like [Teratosphaeria destructans]|uniref:Nitrogen permease regulator 3 n=1 Tax=Teratosphaeria destructans TaxID=418781 RepID=A0A9W7W458_9PEZI|nr:nitrogen permease regulator 3-like [Teratosphaeria destructans]
MDSASGGKSSSTGLIAVFLLTRSRPGPKLIFHYPVAPQISATDGDGSKEHGFDSDLESDDEVAKPSRGPTSHAASLERYAYAQAQLNPNEPYGTSEEKVLGYSTESLERLFSPGRWSDRKKFEVCLDRVTFIGHPVYATGEGDWSENDPDDDAEKKYEVNEHRNNEGSSGAGGRKTPVSLGDELPMPEMRAQTASITITAPEMPFKPNDNSFTHVPDSLESQLATSLGTSTNSNSTTSGVVSEPLTMFHVVFALRDALGAGSNMYHQVAKKLSKALHHCQKQNSYVASESKKMLALKARARQIKISTAELWTQMVESSELAWALKELYQRLAMDDVAGLRLDGNEMSLQCSSSPASVMHDTSLEPQSGLLLLKDKEILLRELQHPDASPLAFFVREHTPTKTLQKLATNMSVPLCDVMYLARHLVKWRKARPITPLHPRNTYVISPDAPTELVPKLVPLYTRRFAALPPLPQILKILSGRPIRYNLLIPSKDHRQAYIDVLAFLTKHGFVKQLKTYGWFQYTPTARDRRASSGAKERQKKRLSGGGISLLSPHLRPIELVEPESSDVNSVSSERSAVTAVAAESPRSRATAQLRLDTEILHSLILDPKSISPEASRALGRIRDSLADAEFRERFTQLCSYLDGEHALEDIAASEGLKRSRVEEWLALLDRGEHLLTFRS